MSNNHNTEKNTNNNYSADILGRILTVRAKTETLLFWEVSNAIKAGEIHWRELYGTPWKKALKRTKRSYYNSRAICENPKHPSYIYYGGRGIKFLFQSFDDFIYVAGLRPDGKLLGRNNKDKDFTVGNLFWGTRKSVQRGKTAWVKRIGRTLRENEEVFGKNKSKSLSNFKKLVEYIMENKQ